MESKAVISDVSRDYLSGKMRLTLTVDRVSTEEVDRLRDKDLRVVLKRWREKRSLDANGYYWTLLDKMAAELHTTKEELHEQMLQRYGTFLYDDDGKVLTITVLAHVDMTKIPGYYLKIAESKDGRFCSYALIKGSSDYDTKEMSTLIDGVVYEAKGLGIETITPDEKERMLQQWGENQKAY